jgi:hypothetical protein
MPLPRRYDFANNRKDRDLAISAYILSGGRYSDDPKTPNHRGMASRLGLDVDMLLIYRNEAPGFDSECEASLLAEDYNLLKKATKGCFNRDGEIVAEKVLTRILETRGIIDKESKSPLAAFQLNAGEGGGIQVSFVEPGQLPPAASETTDAEAD